MGDFDGVQCTSQIQVGIGAKASSVALAHTGHHWSIRLWDCLHWSVDTSSTSRDSHQARPDPSAGGTSIEGEAIVTNTTSRSVLVQQCAADGWLFVGLVNGKVSFYPTSPLIACSPSIQLHPGRNRFPITVATTYQECLQPGGKSTTYVPPCVHTSGLPSLPTGNYTTKVVAVGLPARTSTPRPIMITVTQ